MSTVKANTLQPPSLTQDLTIGSASDTVTLPGNDIQVNTVADSGGNNIIASDGSGSLTVNSAFQGSFTLLATHEPSNVSELEITTNLTDAYGFYLFYFENVVPSTDAAFRFQVNSGTNIVSTLYRTGHGTSDGSTELSLEAGGQNTQKNVTSNQSLTYLTSGGSSEDNLSGEMWFFNPAGTTDYKIWQSRFFTFAGSTYWLDNLAAGQFRTTSAISSIKFLFSSGNIVSGKIKHYGFKE